MHTPAFKSSTHAFGECVFVQSAFAACVQCGLSHIIWTYACALQFKLRCQYFIITSSRRQHQHQRQKRSLIGTMHAKFEFVSVRLNIIFSELGDHCHCSISLVWVTERKTGFLNKMTPSSPTLIVNGQSTAVRSPFIAICSGLIN